MLDCVKIGKKIYDLRTKQHLNQEELAHILYVSRQAISRWEIGDAMPSIDNVVELSKIFSISIEELLCINEEIELNLDNIFQGHDRMFMIQKICTKEINIKVSDIFYQLSNEERMMVLTAILNRQGHIDIELMCKLTPLEQRYIQNARKHNKGEEK